MQLVILHHPIVLYSIIIFDTKLSFHGLVYEFAFIDCRTLLVLAYVPLVPIKCSCEVTIVTLVMVSDLAYGHISIVKVAFKGRLVVWENKITLTMAFIHSIYRATIYSSVLIVNLFLNQGCLFFSRNFYHTTLLIIK